MEEFGNGKIGDAQMQGEFLDINEPREGGQFSLQIPPRGADNNDFVQRLNFPF